MISFLISIVPTSLFIYAVHILFQEKHLFEDAGEWLTNKLGQKWSKPLINCPVCMSSLWGTLAFFVGLPVVFGVAYAFKFWIPYVFCLCGLNTIINKLTSKERIIVEE